MINSNHSAPLSTGRAYGCEYVEAHTICSQSTILRLLIVFPFEMTIARMGRTQRHNLEALLNSDLNQQSRLVPGVNTFD